MPWFVYIIESEVDGDFYKGTSENYYKRLDEHNKGLSIFTSTKRPWKLRFAQMFPTKKETLVREKQLKRQNRRYLEWLVSQSVNILNKDLS
jgi:putative endonuclease